MFLDLFINNGRSLFSINISQNLKSISKKIDQGSVVSHITGYNYLFDK